MRDSTIIMRPPPYKSPLTFFSYNEFAQSSHHIIHGTFDKFIITQGTTTETRAKTNLAKKNEPDTIMHIHNFVNYTLYGSLREDTFLKDRFSEGKDHEG